MTDSNAAYGSCHLLVNKCSAHIPWGLHATGFLSFGHLILSPGFPLMPQTKGHRQGMHQNYIVFATLDPPLPTIRIFISTNNSAFLFYMLKFALR